MKKVDITKHVFIPKHTKLSERETADLLKRYKITSESLPQISKEDPGISTLSVKPGDIIKIVRKSQTSGEAIFYRVVINA